MSNVVILDAARTPHGRFLGGLVDVEVVDLGATVLSALVERTAGDAGDVDWLALGNAIQAGVGQVPARQAVVAADLPPATAATTVNEASGSGLRAIALAVDRIEADRASLAIAGGMESMSNAPHLLAGLRRGVRHGDAPLVDAMIYDSLWDVGYDAHMGELTEELVDRFDLTRAAQDAYAAESHRRAARAVEEGAFADELVPVETPTGAIDTDEGPRPDTTAETLAELPPAFREDGTVTAGNASDLADGAGAVLLADADLAEDLETEPIARVADYAVAYRDPKWFNVATADAVAALLDDRDLAVEDVDRYELNEAFAAQMVYVADRLDLPRDRLNPLGGAVAFGHPIGASGGILTTTLAHSMRAEDATRGVVGMSVGGGGAIAMLLER